VGGVRRRPKSYRDLEVYQLAHRLAVEVHKMTLNLPKFEMFEEGSQIRRAAKSVPANIVEGFGRRRYKREFIRYLTYAWASCQETIEHLEILHETNSLDTETFEYFFGQYDELGRKLCRFLQAVEAGHKSRKEESP